MPLTGFKQGDTWVIDGTRTDTAGNAVSLVGVDILSQMRRNGRIATFDPVVISAADGTYTLTALPLVTKDMPAGVYTFDIQFTQDGVVSSTATDTITVVPDNSRLA